MSPTVGAPTNKPDHPRTDGSIRWQAPELMAGGNSKFLPPMDVYAFAICCVEILTNGRLPWPSLDDDAVRDLVLSAFAFTLFLVFTNLRPSTLRRGK